MKAALELVARWGESDAARKVGLRCTIHEPATPREIDEAWKHGVNDEARALWLLCGEALLFEEPDYGQWGLHLLGPAASAARTAYEQAERPEDIRPSDVVIAEWLGDLELVVLAGTDEQVLAAEPLDERSQWTKVAPNIATLLCNLVASDGERYWEGE